MIVQSNFRGKKITFSLFYKHKTLLQGTWQSFPLTVFIVLEACKFPSHSELGFPVAFSFFLNCCLLYKQRTLRKKTKVSLGPSRIGDTPAGILNTQHWATSIQTTFGQQSKTSFTEKDSQLKLLLKQVLSLLIRPDGDCRRILENNLSTMTTVQQSKTKPQTCPSVLACASISGLYTKHQEAATEVRVVDCQQAHSLCFCFSSKRYIKTLVSQVPQKASSVVIPETSITASAMRGLTWFSECCSLTKN